MVAIGAVLRFVFEAVRPPSAVVWPHAGERFTLASGARAGRGRAFLSLSCRVYIFIAHGAMTLQGDTFLWNGEREDAAHSLGRFSKWHADHCSRVSLCYSAVKSKSQAGCVRIQEFKSSRWRVRRQQRRPIEQIR